MTALRRAARENTGAHRTTPIYILPGSHTAPVLTGEKARDYHLAKWGKYKPSTLLVTVGQHWLIPQIENIDAIYEADA